MTHLLSMKDLDAGDVTEILELAADMKESPGNYKDALFERTLLMVFAKSSVRTRLSFTEAMTETGGHAIYYHTEESTLGEKESMKDFARVISRYADLIMARLHGHDEIEALAEHATVPVINGLTNLEHPCQTLGDLMTIEEKMGLGKARVAYVGDCHNNVLHSLLLGCATLGIDISIAHPPELSPAQNILDQAKKFAEDSGSAIRSFREASEAVADANVVYTDTWMSYHIPDEEKEKRIKMLKPYQVNSELMDSSDDAIFMHCLPATRGKEVTDSVMDSEASVVIDQAENRMHAQKALMVKLFG